MKTIELFQHDKNYNGLIAGVDEAGRGPLCGPVVCACCVMGDVFIDGINDSKKISEKKRELLFEEIINKAIAVGIAIVDEKIIDEINILNATKKCMENAIKNLSITPDIVLIDAVKGLNINAKTESIIKGDAKSYNIAAASIVAKVTRDRLMKDYHEKYPVYNFIKNKGYGTAEHIKAIKEFGASPIHRKTFIKNFTNTNE
ncbi:MAG: ribonuclease HII [Clostridia bacterium]|nr:ribonuclease HII [Clostridia bacterium]